MNIPVNAGTWLVAILPVAVLLTLMLKCKRSALEAAPLGLLAAAAGAMLVFQASFGQIAMDCAKGLWSAFSIVIVICPAVMIYEVSNRSGATDVFLHTLRAFSPNELLGVLAAGAVFPSFLQGITGFGVPVAAGASLLVTMGVRPAAAVVIPLLGQAWGGTFGTLAVGWDALVSSAGLTAQAALSARTAFFAGLFLWVWNLISLLGICWFYGKGRGVSRGLPAVLVLSLVQGGGELLFLRLSPTLACFIPSCLALGAVWLLGRSPWYRQPWRLEDSPAMDRRKMPETNLGQKAGTSLAMTAPQAFLPYLVLTALTLLVLLTPPINKLLGSWGIGFPFPEAVTGFGFVSPATERYAPIALLKHAGMFLLISAGVGYFFCRRRGWLTRRDGRELLAAALHKTVFSGVAVAGFLMMSRVMSGSGQTMVLAKGISNGLGAAYMAFAPFVGMTGSFITSSTMSSNVLFGEFQMLTATLSGMDPAVILAAHTAGASIGNAAAPGSVILGVLAAGYSGGESGILRRILPFALLGVAAVGILAAILSL